MNRDLKSPFVDPSAIRNPGVGHYMKNLKHKTQINTIIPEEASKAFLSGEDRKASYLKSNFIPGPGAYDLNF